MKRVAIIGGGIAGLSAAFYMDQWRRGGAEFDWVLYEASPRLGGVIRTERTAGGFLIEAGPDSFLTEKPWARELCSELGIEDRLIGSNDAGIQQRRTLQGIGRTGVGRGLAFILREGVSRAQHPGQEPARESQSD